MEDSFVEKKEEQLNGAVDNLADEGQGVSEQIEDDQRAVVLIDAIENSLVGSQFRRGEGKGGRQRGRVHIADDVKLIEAKGDGGLEGLLHLQSRVFGDEHEAAQGRLNPFGNVVEFFQTTGGNGDVKTELEEAFDSLDELFLERLSVFQSRLNRRVDHLAVLGIGSESRFHFGDLSF